jgi:hypothetical protein
MSDIYIPYLFWAPFVFALTALSFWNWIRSKYRRRRWDGVEGWPPIPKPLPPMPRPSREQCPACKFAFIPGALRTPEQRQCACATFLGGGL